jgi:hypothetical protein
MREGYLAMEGAKVSAAIVRDAARWHWGTFPLVCVFAALVERDWRTAQAAMRAAEEACVRGDDGAACDAANAALHYAVEVELGLDVLCEALAERC